MWLASFPRSGNTFFRIALEKLYGFQSLSLYEDDPASVSRNPSGRLKNGVSELKASGELHFVKTHELPDDNSPAILLVRDGRDAMVSFAHFIQDYGMVQRPPFQALLARLDDCKQQWLHGRPPFDQLLRRVIDREYFDWSAHYQAWRMGPGRCVVVKFEDLVREPETCVQQSLAELGIRLERCDQAIPTFETLHEQDPKFFRAGSTGQWRAEMSSETEDLFWQEHGTAMRLAGYER